MRRDIQHIFFDLDHTLWDFDTNSRTVWEGLYEEHGLGRAGVCFEEFHGHYCRHNDALWRRFGQGLISREELTAKRMKQTLLDCRMYDVALAQTLSDAYIQRLPTQTALMPGAVEMLDWMGARFPLHIITNGFEQVQLQKIRNAGLEGRFQNVFTSEQCGAAKPSATIFRYAAGQCGAEPEVCLMIGDSPEADVRGALAADFQALHYYPAAPEEAAKAATEPCLRHWNQLEAWLATALS